jgi:hypothetical protein
VCWCILRTEKRHERLLQSEHRRESKPELLMSPSCILAAGQGARETARFRGAHHRKSFEDISLTIPDTFCTVKERLTAFHVIQKRNGSSGIRDRGSMTVAMALSLITVLKIQMAVGKSRY